MHGLKTLTFFFFFFFSALTSQQTVASGIPYHAALPNTKTSSAPPTSLIPRTTPPFLKYLTPRVKSARYCKATAAAVQQNPTTDRSPRLVALRHDHAINRHPPSPREKLEN
ncbi:hypothetical protein HDK77DRAFT_447823 [Phyllosticta capitalensis]|uniref:Secreted protein n=1 Tax=Phyllosticta capitalensis TaxID=121624 RepID=A0ABR1YFU8_9PEZI